jgi:hypothetical protein
MEGLSVAEAVYRLFSYQLAANNLNDRCTEIPNVTVCLTADS